MKAQPDAGSTQLEETNVDTAPHVDWGPGDQPIVKRVGSRKIELIGYVLDAYIEFITASEVAGR